MWKIAVGFAVFAAISLFDTNTASAEGLAPLVPLPRPAPPARVEAATRLTGPRGPA